MTLTVFNKQTQEEEFFSNVTDIKIRRLRTKPCEPPRKVIILLFDTQIDDKVYLPCHQFKLLQIDVADLNQYSGLLPF